MMGCEKHYLPEDRESLSYDMTISNNTFTPILGRNYLMDGNFSVGNSSQPLDFKIVNLRNFDGEAAPELDSSYPVKVWKEPYTGEETSLAEIEKKRMIEYHRPFEVLPHAGIFEMWNAANSSILKTLPDSCYLFDLKVSSNAGGTMYFHDLKLQPYREQDYEPNNFNQYTGNQTVPYSYPSRASLIFGDSTNMQISNIQVTIHRNGNGNKLSFKFLGKKGQPLDPKNFALTDWAHLVHGFNMQMNTDSVTYDVAYPIPLTEMKTNYTNNDGTKATADFYYSRKAFGGMTIQADLGLDFAIHKEGNWTITFQFITDNPKFSDN